MKLKSLYTYFKAYFNYNTSGNPIYGRAVSEAMKVIRDATKNKTLSPIQTYLHKQYSLKITKDMLQRLVSLAMLHYQYPFNEIQHVELLAIIDRNLITTNHRGMEIPIEGGWDNKNNKFIFITFSKSSNMQEEVRVIKGLIKEFVDANSSPANIKTIVYWDLSKGNVTEVDYQTLQPVDRQSLIDAANKL